MNFESIKQAIRSDARFTEIGLQRMDTFGYAFLEQELLKIRAQTFDVIYPGLRARELFPVDHEVPPGAETFAYDSWDKYGRAKIIANGADDLPKANVRRQRSTGRIATIGSSYSYDVFELASQAMAGIPLTARKAEAAREIIEREIDWLAYAGDSTSGLAGLASLISAGTISEIAHVNGDWQTDASITGEKILQDLNKLVTQTVLAAKGELLPDTIVMPLGDYNFIATQPYSSVVPTTVLSVFLKNQPYIKTVVPWVRLDYTDFDMAVASNEPMVCFRRDPQLIQMVVSQEFTQQPPQPRNLAFEVPCHSRFGGLELHYSFAMKYQYIKSP